MVIFPSLLFFLTVAMSGCDNEYDDTGIRTQIAEVTDQVKALQTLTEALQNRDYILSISAAGLIEKITSGRVSIIVFWIFLTTVFTLLRLKSSTFLNLSFPYF